MAEDKSKSSIAWIQFDRIVADATRVGGYSVPWEGEEYVPDFETLHALLGVARGVVGKETTSGTLALALDVWVAYELRRAGFDPDAVWPRATPPRIVPVALTKLYRSFEAGTRAAAAEVGAIQNRLLGSSAPGGNVAASASILGKNYMKQVDVILTGWETGPEILISTKRMDAALGKNAANRVEESYGDAKNLRGRHPLAALGFVYGLGAPALRREPDQAARLMDLLGKLGNEDDAYDAVCLLLIDYDPDVPELDTPAELRAAASAIRPDFNADVVAAQIDRAPKVEVVTTVVVPPNPTHETPQSYEFRVPPELHAGAALKTLIEHVLRITPIALHTEARKRRGLPYQIVVKKKKKAHNGSAPVQDEPLTGLDVELLDDGEPEND